MDSITYKIYHSFEELKDQADEWDLFASSIGSPIYMSYDWCCTWWEHYGKRKSLLIVIFYGEGNIVSILPMYIEEISFLFFQIRVARLVGSNIPPKVFDPPIDSNCAQSVFTILKGIIFEEYNCDLMSFGPVSKQYRPMEKLRAVYQKEQNMDQSYEEMNCDVHSVWYLPNTFEEFLNSLNSLNNKDRKRYELKHLKKHYDVKVDVLSEPIDIVDEFKSFQEMHTQQWYAQGRPGHFKAWRKADIYNLALVRKLSQKNRARLIRISADKTPISYIYGFVYGNSFFAELPARAIESHWNRFDLGRTGIASMISSAIQEGLNKIEGGQGHYDYKVRLGAKEFEIIIVRITADRWQSRLKSKLLRLTFWLLNIVYFKIWYQRLQPHLPNFLQRPIWRIWIKMQH